MCVYLNWHIVLFLICFLKICQKHFPTLLNILSWFCVCVHGTVVFPCRDVLQLTLIAPHLKIILWDKCAFSCPLKLHFWFRIHSSQHINRIKAPGYACCFNFFPFCFLGGSLQQVHLTQDCAVYLSLVSTFLEAISAAASTSTNSLLSSDQRIDWPTEMSLDEALWCLNFQSQITTFLTLKRTYESSGHECTIFLGQMSNISIKCAHPLIQHKIYIY